MTETTTIDPATTDSRKIDALIAKARGLGLVVEVKVVDEVYAWSVDGTVHRVVDVVFTRPQVDPPVTTLDLIHNAERIHAIWGWSREYGRTPKLVLCRKAGLMNDRKVRATSLPYVVQGLAD